MAETRGNILKVRLGSDTRRQVLYNTNISYDDLVLMLQRIFEGKLQPTDDVTLKYFDEDGDLITIADASDFAHAREHSQTGVVKMVIYINGRDIRGALDEVSVLSLKKELGNVRNKVNSIIDSLDMAGLDVGVSEDKTLKMEDVHNVLNPPKTIPTEEISIFDPLKPGDSLTTTSTPQLFTLTTSTVPTQPTVAAATTSATSSSASSTSHLFHGQSGSEFVDPTQSHVATDQVKTQQTGQTTIPHGNPQSAVSPPTAPPPSSSPKPPQPSAYSGYAPTQTGSYQGTYQTGQTGYPAATQSNYQQSSQSGYQSSQTGQMNYQAPQTGYSSAYGSGYPSQSSAPTPPAPVGSTQYPPSTAPNPASYPTASYQSGSYNPPAAGYGQQYSTQNTPSGPPSFPQPTGGAGRGGVTAYGRSPYRVGY